MKNEIQPGKTLSLTAPYARSSGDGVMVGSIIGICVNDALISTAVEVETKGVFSVTKADGVGTAWTVGLKIYWDDVNKNFTYAADDGGTPTPVDNYLAGVAVAAAADGDTTGYLRLNGVF